MADEYPIGASSVNITREYDDGAMQQCGGDETIDWAELLEQLGTGTTFWLTVIDADGRPHTRPLFSVVLGDALFVASSSSAAKTPLLANGAPASLATSTDGLDVVWTGRSDLVTDTGTVDAVAEQYRHTYGWDVSADGSALVAPYGAPTAGPPPYSVFRVDPLTVHAIGTDEPFTGRSTRWTFVDPEAS